LYKIDNIVQTRNALKANGSIESIDHELMLRAKRMGFSDSQIADLVSSNEDTVSRFPQGHEHHALRQTD